MKQVAGLMVAGATAGATAYYGNQYINDLTDGVGNAMETIGFGLKSQQKGSGQSKDSWQWWKYMVPFTIGASVLMNYHDGFFDKDILFDDEYGIDDSNDYLPFLGEGFAPKKG
jgi:hypothetical protein